MIHTFELMIEVDDDVAIDSDYDDKPEDVLKQ